MLCRHRLHTVAIRLHPNIYTRYHYNLSQYVHNAHTLTRLPRMNFNECSWCRQSGKPVTRQYFINYSVLLNADTIAIVRCFFRRVRWPFMLGSCVIAVLICIVVYTVLSVFQLRFRHAYKLRIIINRYYNKCTFTTYHNYSGISKFAAGR